MSTQTVDKHLFTHETQKESNKRNALEAVLTILFAWYCVEQQRLKCGFWLRGLVRCDTKHVRLLKVTIWLDETQPTQPTESTSRQLKTQVRPSVHTNFIFPTRTENFIRTVTQNNVEKEFIFVNKKLALF